MKDLPKVYASPINKVINNEQKCYRSDMRSSSSVSVYDIDKLLSNNKYLYRSKVLINGEEKLVIKRVDNYLLTIDNEKIPVDDIRSIKLI